MASDPRQPMWGDLQSAMAGLPGPVDDLDDACRYLERILTSPEPLF